MGVLTQRGQALLKRLGIYHRLKASGIYSLYWTLADRRIIQARSAEVRFYRKVLTGFHKGALVFDIGANHGQKTDVFLRLGAKVVAVEPDHLNQAILKEKFLRYRIKKKPVTVVGKAVSEKTAVETMWIDSPGSAKNTLSLKWAELLRVDDGRFGATLQFAEQRDVATITLEDLIAEHGLPFFIKIDVEGYEPSVLQGLHRPVPWLSFEVNLPQFKPEGRHCIELLGNISSEGMFNYAVDCQSGLKFNRWLNERDFLKALDDCNDSSIEVFWKSHAD